MKKSDESNNEDRKEVRMFSLILYGTLYSHQWDISDIWQFVDLLSFPHLTELLRDILDILITVQEILKAAKSLHPDKAWRPDGFSVEFSKCFANSLVNSLLSLFQASIKLEHIPPTWKDARTTVIPSKIKIRLFFSHTDSFLYLIKIIKLLW